MSVLFKLAAAAAVATSGIALYDAAHHGLTGRYSEFSEESTIPALILVSETIHGLTYAVLAAVLVIWAKSALVSRLQRLMARLLAVNLGVFAVFSLVVDPIAAETGGSSAAVENVTSTIGGGLFLLMFLLAFALGLTLLRTPDRRLSAVLLVAIAPVVLLTVVAAILGSGFAHPAYAETLVHVGVALLALPATVAHRNRSQAAPSTTATA